jgi:hypothetical protein
MADNFFKIKNGAKLEPKAGSTVTVEGEIAYNDTSNQLEVFGTSAAESITTTTNTQTLTNKTLSGPVITTPTITVTDSGLSITDNSDATKIVKFEASGITTATTRTLTVPDANTTIVGTDATQTLTNKTISGNTAVNLISGSGTLTLNTSGTATVPNATDTLVGKATTDTLTNKTFDADGTGNSITNIENADIKAAAAIALDKLAATTASRALVSDVSGFVSPSSVTSTEIGYVSGVTSAIQTQINTKAPSASPTFTGTVTTPATASRALVTGASSELTASTTTATELGYVNGVTSAIQTQLDAKVAKTLTTTTGDMIYASSANTPARLPIGTSSQILTVSGGIPSWAAAPSGGINYLSANPKAEVDTTGWTTYADAAQNTPVNGTDGSPNITWTRTTTSPLRDTASFLFTRDAANRQGEGVAYPFTIDQADRGQVLAITCDYKVVSGTLFAADGITAPLNDGTTSQNAGMSDLEIFVYDVTNSVLIPVTPQVLTSTSAVSANFKGRFQAASNSTSYRLIIHTARSTAVAFTIQFDNFFVGPQAVNYGYAGTDWATYTPSFTGFGTPTSVESQWRRDGSDILIRVKFATGTNTATEARVSFPSGVTSADSTTIPTIQRSGEVATNLSSSVPIRYVLMEPSVTYVTFAKMTASTTDGLTKLNGNTWSNGDLISLIARVPVAGWSSNVQMSNDTETRVVAAQYTGNGGTAITAGVTNIDFATKVQDTHSVFNGTTFTAPVSGFYKFSGAILFNANIDAIIYAYVNTVLKILVSSVGNLSHGRYVLTGGIYLNAGDALTFRSDTNGTLTNSASAHWIYFARESGPSAIASSEKVFLQYTSNGGTALTANTTNIDWGTKVVDSHSAFSSTAFTAPKSAFYYVTGVIKFTGSVSAGIYAYVNATGKTRMNTIASAQYHGFSGSIFLNAGDSLTVRSDTNATLSSSATDHTISISSQG